MRLNAEDLGLILSMHGKSHVVLHPCSQFPGHVGQPSLTSKPQTPKTDNISKTRSSDLNEDDTYSPPQQVAWALISTVLWSRTERPRPPQTHSSKDPGAYVSLLDYSEFLSHSGMGAVVQKMNTRQKGAGWGNEHLQGRQSLPPACWSLCRFYHWPKLSKPGWAGHQAWGMGGGGGGWGRGRPLWSGKVSGH